LNNIKHSTLAIIALLLLISTPAFAELKTFEKEYTYQASEFDRKASTKDNDLFFQDINEFCYIQ